MSRLTIGFVLILCVVAAGCRTPPACVGTYEWGGLAKMRHVFELTAPDETQAERDRNTKYLEVTARISLVLHADGTWDLHNPGRGIRTHGAFAVDGDKVTLCETGGSTASPVTMEFRYNQAEGTLGSGEPGDNPAFRKKR